MGLGHWFKKGSVWGGLMVLVMNTTTVWAHPHSWIDTTTTIEGDGQAITGFHMAWTFDPMTTAYMLDGEDMSTQQRENTLHKVALSVINNMLSSHYFTYFFEPDGAKRRSAINKSTPPLSLWTKAKRHCVLICPWSSRIP